MKKEEIQAIVENAIDKRKSVKTNYQLGKYLKPGDDYSEIEYPEYYNTYSLAIELAEQNRYHAEKGVFPAKIFKKKSPNQSEEEFTYVKENYQQVTLPVGIDYMNTISRAFNDGNFSIKYPEDEDKTLADAGMSLQNYLQNGIYIYGSLENFMKFVYPSLKTIDANGVIAVKPELKYSEVNKGNKKERIVKSTELNEPQPYYFDCSRIIAFKDEHYALIETTNQYEASNETKKPKKKAAATQVYTYEFYDTNDIWQIEFDTQKDEVTKFELYYSHKWNRLPVEKIKGIPRIINGEVLWQSQFSFATDLLNLVAMNSSTLNIVFDKCGFPTRVIQGSPCLFEYKDVEGNIDVCQGRGVVYDSTVQKFKVCPGCNGTKMQANFSPMKDFFIPVGDQLDPAGKTTGKPFYYEAPDTSIITILEDHIEKNELKARKILNIHSSTAIVKGQEDTTATGTAIDQKQMFAFIKPISDQMFDMWQFIADACAFMRYGSKAKNIVITKPVTFDFNTEFDYMFELSEAVKAGFPPFVVQAILERYLNSYFFTSEKIVKSFQLIIETDKLMGLSLSDISIQQSKSLIPGWQWTIHASALGLINELILENPKFFEQDLTKQKEQLIALAKKNVEDNKPASNITDIKNLILNGNKPAAGAAA